MLHHKFSKHCNVCMIYLFFEWHRGPCAVWINTAVLFCQHFLSDYFFSLRLSMYPPVRSIDIVKSTLNFLERKNDKNLKKESQMVKKTKWWKTQMKKNNQSGDKTNKWKKKRPDTFKPDSLSHYFSRISQKILSNVLTLCKYINAVYLNFRINFKRR